MRRTTIESGMRDGPHTGHDIRAAAYDKHHKPGVLEVDTFDTVIKQDGGAFVQCWVWVSYPDVAEAKADPNFKEVARYGPAIFQSRCQDTGRARGKRSGISAGQSRRTEVGDSRSDAGGGDASCRDEKPVRHEANARSRDVTGGAA